MRKLQAAVKKELNAFERNSRIQTMALADSTDTAALAAAEGNGKKKSNKEDEDENAEENAEFDEGKLRFAGTTIQLRSRISFGNCLKYLCGICRLRTI